MNNVDVLVIGRSCLDYIAVVKQFPIENQKLPLEFRLTEGGGQGGTSSCCISRLGGKVAYVGKLGDDDEGSAASCGSSVSRQFCMRCTIPGTKSSARASAELT